MYNVVFIQPRDFVTYCRHRWLNNGTVQFITNQACEHISCDDNDNTASDNDNTASDNNNNKYRAYSLRGATLISKSKGYPNDQRTKIIMLSHCNCGKDIPEWAVRTAVGILAPIKPFEIINRIEMGIQHSRSDLDKAEAEAEAEKEDEEATMKAIKEEPASSSAAASNVERGGGGRRTIRRSTRPAGIAQMGYGAFWPDGGGLLEEDDDEEEDTPYYDETI